VAGGASYNETYEGKQQLQRKPAALFPFPIPCSTLAQWPI